MPQSFKDKLLIPVEVPAWGVIALIVSGAFASGGIYFELKEVAKNQAKGQDKIELMFERQIRNIETVNQHKEILRAHDVRLQDHELRLLQMERSK